MAGFFHSLASLPSILGGIETIITMSGHSSTPIKIAGIDITLGALISDFQTGVQDVITIGESAINASSSTPSTPKSGS